MKKAAFIIIVVAILVVGWIAFCGYRWSWGPFHSLHNVKTAKLPGNGAQYAMENQNIIKDSPLAGKRIIYLGSSVTYGAASQGVSFADFIARRNGCEAIKEAVSGTTLMDNGTDSYVSRLKRLNAEGDIDLFVCQLSTNDASRKMPVGTVSDSFSMEDFDTGTTAGAMEYIIAYAKEVYSCPVVFYTGPRYDSEAYEGLVELLEEIRQKWGISVIDMWNDEAFNDISDEQRGLYLADPIHPTKAGYLEWWTPYFESAFFEMFQ